ncbi:RING-type domain-containing protein [Psidium guajava]|nr:RING-type domain-containing protein [Psidium guajava]
MSSSAIMIVYPLMGSRTDVKLALTTSNVIWPLLLLCGVQTWQVVLSMGTSRLKKYFVVWGRIYPR